MKRSIFLLAMLLVAFSISAQWMSQQSVDPMSDQRITGFVLQATSGTNSYGNLPFLVIRFTDEYLEIFVVFKEYFPNDFTSTSYRFDKKDVEFGSWSVGSDSDSVFCPEDTVVPFLNMLMKSESVAIRATTVYPKSITSVFNLRGLEAELSKYPELKAWVERNR